LIDLSSLKKFKPQGRSFALKLQWRRWLWLEKEEGEKIDAKEVDGGIIEQLAFKLGFSFLSQEFQIFKLWLF
jgi:hypothetical protein